MELNNRHDNRTLGMAFQAAVSKALGAKRDEVQAQASTESTAAEACANTSAPNWHQPESPAADRIRNSGSRRVRGRCTIICI